MSEFGILENKGLRET